MRRIYGTLKAVLILGGVLAASSAMAVPVTHGPMTCSAHIADATTDYGDLKKESIPELVALVPKNEARAQAYAKYLKTVSGPALKKLYSEFETLAAKYFPGFDPKMMSEAQWEDAGRRIMLSKEGRELAKRYRAAVRTPSLAFIKKFYPDMKCDDKYSDDFGDSYCYSADGARSVTFSLITAHANPTMCSEMYCAVFTDSTFIAPYGWGETRAVGAGASIGLDSGRTYELQTVKDFSYPRVSTSRREPDFESKTIRFVESQAKGKRFYQVDHRGGISLDVPMHLIEDQKTTTNRDAYETFVWERMLRRHPECLEEADEKLHAGAKVSGPGYQPGIKKPTSVKGAY